MKNTILVSMDGIAMCQGTTAMFLAQLFGLDLSMSAMLVNSVGIVIAVLRLLSA